MTNQIDAIEDSCGWADVRRRRCAHFQQMLHNPGLSPAGAPGLSSRARPRGDTRGRCCGWGSELGSQEAFSVATVAAVTHGVGAKGLKGNFGSLRGVPKLPLTPGRKALPRTRAAGLAPSRRRRPASRTAGRPGRVKPHGLRDWRRYERSARLHGGRQRPGRAGLSSLPEPEATAGGSFSCAVWDPAREGSRAGARTLPGR